MGLKDGIFQVWSTPEPQVTFLGVKNQPSPKEAFFAHPVYNKIAMKSEKSVNFVFRSMQAD